MKSTYIKLSIATALMLSIYSCKKGEAVSSDYETAELSDSALPKISDSISSVASMSVKDKQFIKTADVNMEVKDVYNATISIEKSVQELGGFVTKSHLLSNVVSEKIYNISDENATLVKKYQSENSMQVKVPAENLGELLTMINNSKLFLNSRIINAEDVTARIKYAELEREKIKKTGENISQLKTSKDKVIMEDGNMEEKNGHQLSSMNMKDDLQYSTVEIFIKEPRLRTAEIAISNTNNIDNRYKFNFIYDAKNAFVEGFYIIQRIFIFLISMWPFIIIAGTAFYFYRKNSSNHKIQQTIKEQNPAS